MDVTIGQLWRNKKSGRIVRIRTIKLADTERLSKVFYDNIGPAISGKRYMRNYGRAYLDSFLKNFVIDI